MDLISSRGAGHSRAIQRRSVGQWIAHASENRRLASSGDRHRERVAVGALLCVGSEGESRRQALKRDESEHSYRRLASTKKQNQLKQLSLSLVKCSGRSRRRSKKSNPLPFFKRCMRQLMALFGRASEAHMDPSNLPSFKISVIVERIST